MNHSFCISVIPFVLLSFLPNCGHSFGIGVIPSELLSFLPYYCHSFQILSFLPNYCHSSISLAFLLNYILSFQIFVILSSSYTLPYPRARKLAGHFCEYLVKIQVHYVKMLHQKLFQPIFDHQELHQISYCQSQN